MENNKYYTPLIEEFHVGFEYQKKYIIANRVQWSNKVVGRADSINYIDISLREPKMDGAPIRVKYLDKEDIESLGWRIDGRGDYSIDSFYISWHTGEERPIWVEITKEDEGCVFDGKLKNKSELKRLMQQLNIINNETEN
jgi:hypothetical protein